jgi:hypothetical protein
MTSRDIAVCVDKFFADRKVQRFLDLARETRPLQICFPREVPITRFLAWVFDPSQGHGLQDAAIRRMLTAAWGCRDDANIDLNMRRLLSPAQLSTRSFIGSVVQKEVRLLDGKGQLDILIMHPQSKLLIAVENKFGAGQGDDQLKRYSKALAKRYPDWDRVQIFLDLYGQSPNDDTWIGLDFEWLADELRVAESSPWLGEESKRVIREFRASIELEGDTYTHLSLDDSELLEIVTEHKPVLKVMEEWQRSRQKLPDLVDDIFSSASTLRDKALQQLLPVYWQRTELWRLCIGMLSYAEFYAAAREKYSDVLHDPYRKAFYFAMPMWLGIQRSEANRWPVQVMVRFLSSNDVNKARFVVISTLDVDQVGDEWKPSVRELAASLRATNLKKNRKLKEDQGRTTLRVDYAKTESDAIKLLLSHLSMVNAAMVALLSKEPR